MKLTNGEIFNAQGPFQKLTAIKFPVKTSLALVKLIQKLNAILEPVEQVRIGLVKTYGKADPDTRRTQVSPEDEGWEKFQSELTELMAQDTEVVFEPVELPETLEIEPAILVALEKFIKVA